MHFPALSRTRTTLIATIAELAADLPAARKALRVSAGLDNEIMANAQILEAPTISALQRYTGVLYTSLQTPRISSAERSRANQRILITSALFGLVTAGTQIPAYRLSAGSSLPGLPSVAAIWRADLTEVLADLEGPVLDLRSGAYAAFAPLPGAINVRVVTRTKAGDLKPVSHDNKAIKGVLARVVATTRASIDSIPKLVALARRSGLELNRTGSSAVELIAPGAN